MGSPHRSVPGLRPAHSMGDRFPGRKKPPLSRFPLFAFHISDFQPAPARARPGEALALGSLLRDLVNQAYALTPDEIATM